MRLALISDIHGNLPALEAVLAQVARAGVDRTINLGDILSGPLWPRETARHLMPLGLPTIRGNHERQLLTQARERMSPADAITLDALEADDLAWLRELPTELWLSEDLLCCHGTPHSDLQYFLETITPDFGQSGSRGVRAANAAEIRERLGSTSAAVVLCGHTHVPRVTQLPDGPLIVNPGSVGLQAFDDDHLHVHVVENGSPHARWALLERDDGTGRCSVALHSTDYDWRSAAARAMAKGRPDWADALATGCVGRFEKDCA